MFDAKFLHWKAMATLWALPRCPENVLPGRYAQCWPERRLFFARKKGCKIQETVITNPICSMYGIFTYKTGGLLGQMLVNIPYMEHMGMMIHL